MIHHRHEDRYPHQLLRREIPDGDPGAIFDRAVTLLLEQVESEKLGMTATVDRNGILLFVAPASRRPGAAVLEPVPP